MTTLYWYILAQQTKKEKMGAQNIYILYFLSVFNDMFFNSAVDLGLKHLASNEF